MDWTDMLKLHYTLFSLLNLRSKKGIDGTMCTISATFERKSF